MTESSPFARKRYEHEGHHVYFLPDDAMQEVERHISTYLVGTRGTGKTTLLKALAWEERLDNPSLRTQLGDTTAVDRYLGVYLKLPTFLLELLEKWLSPTDELLHARVTALYLDLIWLETALDGLVKLRNRGVVAFDPDKEAEEVKRLCRWMDERGGIPGLDKATARPTLGRLKRALSEARRGIERAAGAASDPSAVAETLPIDQIGALGREGAERLAKLADPSAGDPGVGWHIRVCLDEGEVLSKQQQIVLNTMLRLSEAPLFFVVAYAAMPHDPTTVLFARQTLASDDRQLLVRDDMADDSFEALAEGVASVRAQQILGDAEARIDVRRLLGSLELDRWAAEALSRSEADRAQRLLERAEEMKDALPDNGELPVLEAFLREKASDQRPERPPTDRRELRYRRSTGVRKKRPGAYLGLCAEFGLEPRYASSQMVYQMSDKCIRDFLSQMHHIFVARGLNLTAFLDSPVPMRVQDAALKRASENKRDSIGRTVESSPPDEAQRVIDGLALVTGRLQQSAEPAERGIFVVKPNCDEAIVSHIELLRDASQGGFLRILTDDDDRFVFRVHTSLAAAYRFSYRGAYYELQLPVTEIAALREATTPARRQETVEAIVRRIEARRPAQASGVEPLPGETWE